MILLIFSCPTQIYISKFRFSLYGEWYSVRVAISYQVTNYAEIGQENTTLFSLRAWRPGLSLWHKFPKIIPFVHEEKTCRKNLGNGKLQLLTLSEDSKSENCNKSSTAHEEDVKLGACCGGIFMVICCEFWLGGGSEELLSVSLAHFELKATRIPVAKNLWWLAARLPAEWIGSSQSRQKRALSSTQKMKAAFSCKMRDR